MDSDLRDLGRLINPPFRGTRKSQQVSRHTFTLRRVTSCLQLLILIFSTTPGPNLGQIATQITMAAKRKALHLCAYEGDLATVRDYIDEDASFLLKKDDDGRLPLHWACSGKHVDIARFLLDSDKREDKATVNAKDDADWTPLMIAVSVGEDTIVEMLLRAGADPNAANEAGVTALVGFSRAVSSWFRVGVI